MVACGKDGGSGPSRAETEFLVEHNVEPGGLGRTVRWPDGPIPAFANNIAREDEVAEWTAVSGGKVRFTFVGSRPASGISFDFTGEAGICAATLIAYRGDGVIVSAEVRVVRAIFRGPQCVRTITHETGHAIGFLGHTSDGGLMDENGGGGQITGPVAEMIRNLYSMAPGTPLGLAQKPRTTLLPSRGRYTARFVYPVR